MGQWFYDRHYYKVYGIHKIHNKVHEVRRMELDIIILYYIKYIQYQKISIKYLE